MSAIPLERDSSAARTRAVAPAPKDWGRLVAEGRAARAQADGGRWRIGHLADMVEHRYRSRAVQQFADDIGESYSTVRRYRWVVTRYEPGVRFRFPGLAFSHFQAVAGLPDRVAWLERAELGCWSVDRLVQESRGRTEDATASPMPRLRAALGGAVRSLSDVEALDDKALARAAREWLGETLDELEERVVSVRERLSAVVKPKTTSLNRYKVTGRKTKGRASQPAANGKAKPAQKLPVNPF